MVEKEKSIERFPQGSSMMISGGVHQWMTRDSQSAHCPAHPTDLVVLSEPWPGKGIYAVPPRYYNQASVYAGIAVTLDDSIHQDYVLDNVCFVQTWLPGPV